VTLRQSRGEQYFGLTAVGGWQVVRLAYGADLVKAVGRSYGTMGLEDWRTLATIMKSLGWRSRRADGVQCWRPDETEATA
jgi:hypothetical protein